MAEPKAPVQADALSILNVRNIVTIALLALVVYLMWLIRGVFAMFLAAMVISFLLYPSVRVLSEVGIAGIRINRALACVIVLIGSIGVLGLATFAIVNLARDQYLKLQTTLQDPSKTADAKTQIIGLVVRYEGLLGTLGVDTGMLLGERGDPKEEQLETAPNPLDTLPSIDEAYEESQREAANPTPQAPSLSPLEEQQRLEERVNFLFEEYLPNEAIPRFKAWAKDHISVSAILGGIGNAIGILVAMPIIIFYMLKDARQIRDTLLGFIPPAFLGASTGFLSALEETLNSYLRGQISLSLWIFILDSILLSAFTDLDSWLILSLIAGFTEIIPVVGPTIALVIGCVVALVEGGGDAFVRVAIIFTFVQIVENQVLVPRIMGKELDVHPLTVMFFLLAGGILGGVVGALLSLPVAATLKVMLQQYYPGFVKRIEALLVDEPVPSAVLVLPRGVEALPHAGGVIAAKTPEGPVLLIPDGPAEKKPDGGIIVPGHGYSDEGERG